MKSIEITTAQKVIIQYELASLRDRVVSYLLDMVILGTIILALFFAIAAVAFDNAELFTTLCLMILVPVFVFYTLVSELVMNGQSLGKRATGLKIVRLDGKVPTLDDLLMRWVFRWIDIYTSFGAVAALLISAGDKSQRLGGLLSNTAVVRLKGRYNIMLADLEAMFGESGNVPSFPGVTQFSDREMLAVKELVKRYNRYPNDAHRDLVNRTAEILSRRLDIPLPESDLTGFLKTVIKDYVMLTR